MKTISRLTVLISIFFVSSSFADVSESEELQYDSEKQASIVTPTDPYLKWQKYLSEKGIREGANNRSDGSVFLIAYGSKKVGKSLDDSKFMNSRVGCKIYYG